MAKETTTPATIKSCYYSIARTKTTIDFYYTRRTQHSHIFQRLDKEDLRWVSSVALVSFLPKRTHEDNVVFFGKLMDTRAECFKFVKLFQMLEMVSVLGVLEEVPANGHVIVFDCKGFGFVHLTSINLMVLKHMLDHLQEGAPVRIKEIHFINALSVMDKLMALAKPLLSNELFHMIQFHSSLDTFYKYVPKECLPEEYGGSIPSCQSLQETNLERLLNNYDLFVQHDSLKVNESKRLEKSRSFGIEGTFKKLEID